MIYISLQALFYRRKIPNDLFSIKFRVVLRIDRRKDLNRSCKVLFLGRQHFTAYDAECAISTHQDLSTVCSLARCYNQSIIIPGCIDKRFILMQAEAFTQSCFDQSVVKFYPL